MSRFVPPLLDRLIDSQPASRSEPMRPALSLAQLKESVARDVESLLNARHGSSRDALAAYSNVQASVASFGLDDFAAMSMSSTVDRAAICRSIERAISDHEPRLRSVVVDLDRRDVATQKMRFAIQAVLVVHPLNEPVSFDAVLQTTTQNYAVQIGRGPGRVT